MIEIASMQYIIWAPPNLVLGMHHERSRCSKLGGSRAILVVTVQDSSSKTKALLILVTLKKTYISLSILNKVMH